MVLVLVLVVAGGCELAAADGVEVDGVELSAAATLVGVEADGTASASASEAAGDSTVSEDVDVDGAAAASTVDTSADCC